MAQQETTLKPQQERSRRTLERLLSATVRTLHESGLEGATIPRIARAAGVSPAAIYRRFKDKQDLLRAALLEMLETSQAQNRLLQAKALTGRGLVEASRRFIELTFAQYRQRGQLLGALNQFMQADNDSEFVQAARRIIEGNLDLVVQNMLAYRKEIVHANPERALRIAILTASTAIQTIFFMPRTAWNTLQPMTDEELIEELALGFVAYLKAP